MIKAVIFDFFGVLYPDTLWGLADVFIPDRNDEQKRALRDIVTRSDHGMISREQFWREAADVYGVSVSKALAEKEKLGSADTRLLDVIKQLKMRGMKTAVMSNVGVGFLDNVFDDAQRKAFFDELILSGEIGITKPSKQIYEVAAQRLGVELSECLFFDDAPHNVDGAVAAGMKAEQYEGVSSCVKALKAYGVPVSSQCE